MPHIPAWLANTLVYLAAAVVAVPLSRALGFGSIEIGKRGDLVVLNEDPLTLPLERIWDRKTNKPVDLVVDYTIVGGNIEHARA